MAGRLPCNGNLILFTDSYKVTHHEQYPANTTKVYSYFESRGGKFSDVLVFGLQYIIKQWLEGCVVTHQKIAEAKELFKLHFGQDVFNESGWAYIADTLDGRLPLRICAVPEGTIVQTKNVLFTVENTDPKCYWLTNWFETMLVQVWYPMTVATVSREQKKMIAKYLNATADTMDGLPFKLHDFGFRGVSSGESAAIGGCAHLINFQGTDTLAALLLARDFYGCPIAGFSIPASEHSTMTSWTKKGEVDGFRNMLDKFPSGLVACVSDSYNIWHACKTLWGEKLKDAVIKRGETDSTLVVRPDSGSPPVIVIQCLELLGRAFGTTTNKKGYKLLPSYLRIIQGDGIDIEMLEIILQHMESRKWSADNIAFGSGGALLQKMNRDTQKFAYKCSFAVVDGVERDVFKKPISDAGKKSKKGRLTLEQHADGSWVTVQEGKGIPIKDKLEPLFENGELLRTSTFEEIRERAKLGSVERLGASVKTCGMRAKIGKDCAVCDHNQWTIWSKEWLA